MVKIDIAKLAEFHDLISKYEPISIGDLRHIFMSGMVEVYMDKDYEMCVVLETRSFSHVENSASMHIYVEPGRRGKELIKALKVLEGVVKYDTILASIPEDRRVKQLAMMYKGWELRNDGLYEYKIKGRTRKACMPASTKIGGK